ncbi:tetratricopeptide repeat protein 28 [Nephila pilipes]|uniref:Tetratricopeptide repeat protein 28 n=1 Tax=Nephila pilipes TaxID=299642 RepID=A0A8X6TMU4_NEPPI|nr:tetratricopeptide repeat protein 28 [Nephila pilipes]
MGKEFCGRACPKLNKDRSYYKGHLHLVMVETKAQVHQVDINKHYPSSETGETMNCGTGENSMSSVCDIRDQGDGGSFTDSCPSQNQDLFPPSLKHFPFLDNIDNQGSKNGHSKEIASKKPNQIVWLETFRTSSKLM